METLNTKYFPYKILNAFCCRFDIIKKLGQGTYGKVQLGINKETGQEVSALTVSFRTDIFYIFSFIDYGGGGYGYDMMKNNYFIDGSTNFFIDNNVGSDSRNISIT
jgi:serine/threonine protein kinase